MTTGQEVGQAPAPSDAARGADHVTERPLDVRARASRAAVVASLILIAGGGAIVGVMDRTRDEAFILHATHARSVSASDVSRHVGRTPEPVALAARTPTTSSVCLPGGPGGLRNPWRCTVRFRSGRTAHYEVKIAPDGSYIGFGTAPIHGCCVAVPRFD
jgi:hypothetical protein